MSPLMPVATPQIRLGERSVDRPAIDDSRLEHGGDEHANDGTAPISTGSAARSTKRCGAGGAAGDFPPSFERKLDELFARFTPTGTHDDHFTDALKLADRSAYFDAQVPFGSRRRPQGFTKWVLWQAEAWFVNYVVRQLNHFSCLDHARRAPTRRKARRGRARSRHARDARAARRGRDRPRVPTPAPFTDLLVQEALEPRAPDGRVLHAECGDGSLVDALADADLDVYGIDPGYAQRPTRR